MNEPNATAIVLLALGLLLGLSAAFGRLAGRLGMPLFLAFLCIGMLAGSEGIGGIQFEDPAATFRLGTFALVLILFDGGLNTTFGAARSAAGPASVLATVGVALTAALLAVIARLLGLPWPEAMLLGAIVSSTDAAAVFAILRGSGLSLQRRVASILEVESGANDPMAVLLTLAIAESLVGGTPLGWRLIPSVLLQLLIGGALGIGIGFGSRLLLRQLQLHTAGLYSVLTVAIAFVAFAVATLVHGSGFLAVYVAGLVLGNGQLPYRAGLLRVHDSLAWLSQIGMFLLLGLLAFPSQLVAVAPTGLVLGILLAVVARPAAVALCLLPFRLPWKEVLFVSWIGLRGAVPIVLATIPILAGTPGAHHVFNLVFFIVVVSAIAPGWTVGAVTRRLKLDTKRPPDPEAVLEIASNLPVRGEIVSYFIDPASAVAGSTIAELPFPEGTGVLLVIRGRILIPARGKIRIEPGDHVTLFTSPEAKPLLNLLFGGASDE
jgi:potassium/hydrogen antiporter